MYTAHKRNPKHNLNTHPFPTPTLLAGGGGRTDHGGDDADDREGGAAFPIALA